MLNRLLHIPNPGEGGRACSTFTGRQTVNCASLWDSRGGGRGSDRRTYLDILWVKFKAMLPIGDEAQLFCSLRQENRIRFHPHLLDEDHSIVNGFETKVHH